MKLFVCPVCQQTLHFENSECTKCHSVLAYLPEHTMLTALGPAAGGPEGVFVALGKTTKGGRYRMCGNRIDHNACNWAVPEAENQRFCRSCRLNEVIPNLSDPKAKQA